MAFATIRALVRPSLPRLIIFAVVLRFPHPTFSFYPWPGGKLMVFHSVLVPFPFCRAFFFFCGPLWFSQRFPPEAKESSIHGETEIFLSGFRA